MIIKEYRIPMPLDVDEYRIAQLYMIAKKSKLESEGEGSGVEIVANQPYTEGPGGSGQYTDKIYHVSAHLPIWLRGLIPKAVSTIREEAWNAYPYSMNKIYTPLWEKFHIEIESKYLPGGTKQENVFGLTTDQLAEREVEVVDFVKEKLCGNEYIEAEDPTTYVSTKTKRGPLTENWLEAYESEKLSETSEADHDKKNQNFMCVYKICRVRCDQWPIQYRVEKFTHDKIRKMLIEAHLQAWAWQDEWTGLDMNQIREMERETQLLLAEKMRKNSNSCKQ